MESQPSPIPQSIRNLLVCPVCKGKLQWGAPTESIRCTACDRCYPVVDGIPVLLRDRSTFPNVAG